MNQSDKSLFPNRIGRLAYALRYFIMLVILVTGSILVDIGTASENPGIKLALNIAAIVIMVFGLIALFRSVLFPRLRDVGIHCAWSLLVLVPILNLLFVVALLFIPQDAFSRNKRNA